jgi:hypothetical protein
MIYNDDAWHHGPILPLKIQIGTRKYFVEIYPQFWHELSKSSPALL